MWLLSKLSMVTGHSWQVGSTHYWDVVFPSGDVSGFSMAGSNLKRGIRMAKRLYGKGHQVSKDMQRLWRGFEAVKGYKPTVPSGLKDPALPDSLNMFCPWFEATNNKGLHRLPTLPTDKVLQLSADSVRRVFSRINPWKAAGPSHVPSSVQKNRLQHPWYASNDFEC